MYERFQWPVTPLANEGNMVIYNDVRITMLTSRLIRVEQDAKGIFEDRASQSVFHRDFPKTEFTVNREQGLKIETEHLVLSCGDALDSLTITLKTAPGTTWHYGDQIENLGGTVPTLDGINGRLRLQPGVCSRLGFAVLEDSERMILQDGWVDVRRENTKDFYVFAYGWDYKAAVADLYRLTGVPPLLPDYALGNWWSRYHAYTQDEYIGLMDKFREEDLPFSVGVVDMDWHYVRYEMDEQTQVRTKPPLPGWTGYTWNTDLFPDYKQFLKDLHNRGLKTALNLHPAEGIRKNESMYEEMCKALGKEADGNRCALDILSQEYMAAYFDVVHHPYEEDGVDFWWMDWQQGANYGWIHEPNENGKMQDPREALDPLWQLNHLHILDISRQSKRPMFFSRYSGPGSHRYPVGFSGDTMITWENLDFQPEFTATASNIGYGWWSHDIGGHYMGYRDDELIARWVQLGVFSPINRLHSSNSAFINKEPWDFDAITEKVMRQSLKLRHQLFPYLYTMNYRTHLGLEPLVQPMYYSHPQCSEAYEVKNQFWFGDQMLVAPITQKADPVTRLGDVEVWLPDGIWTDFFTGSVYNGDGGRKMKMFRDAYSMPVLCKAGAIVPMRKHIPNDNRLSGAKELELMVFPGGDNGFTMYEDAGDGYAYREGGCAKTDMQLTYTDTRAEFTVAEATGDVSFIPEGRTYTVKFRGFKKPERVLLDGAEAAFAYDADTHTITVQPGKVAFTVVLECEDLRNRGEDWLNHVEKLLKFAQMGMQGKSKVYTYVKERGKDLLPIYYHYQFNTNSQEELKMMWPILELCTTEKYVYPKLY